MKTVVPDYYPQFRCIAGKCRHTCCVGWEIDIDEESLPRMMRIPAVAAHIELAETPHIRLTEGERCPFLNRENLCDMILSYGEESLCGICRDHPRFRNFWSDRVEIGLGMVCEEAARLILSQKEPMRLTVLSDDGTEEELPEDERFLTDLRDRMLREVETTGPAARLTEYLIYRHLPDALYDDRLEERIAFVRAAYREITDAWSKTDGSTEALAECARAFSYDVEYDDEELEHRLERLTEENQKRLG